MRFRSIPRYLTGMARGLKRAGPRSGLKLFTGSPLAVQDVPAHDFSIVVNVRDPAISKPVLCTGQYEPQVAAALARYFRDGIRFLDVGANIGYFSLLVASQCPRASIISIEPDAANLRLFRASIALNGFDDRIEVIQAAASDTTDDLFFSDLGDNANLGARFTAKSEDALKARNPAADTCRVHAVRLDDVLAERSVDLVKVDIEGYEPHAFAGMRRTLERDKPVVITEFAPGTIQHITGSDPEDLLRSFVELGYTLHIIESADQTVDCGDDVRFVMDMFHEKDQHHLDLLLLP